jgi:glutaconate CoA-transferase subunit A
VRDNDYYQAWDVISRDRHTFLSWLREKVLAGNGHGG